MFLVTFHGGKDSIQQVYKYEYDGTGGAPYLTQATPSGKNGFRDIQFLPFERGGLFYLVNSSKEASEVFQIAPDATSVPPPFVNGVGGTGTGPELCSVYHPFSIALDQAMTVCYIACQDSNVVVRVGGPNSTNPGQPLDINPSLPQPSQGEAYLPGTFVASQIPLVPDACNWPDKQTPPVVKCQDGGLNASPSDLEPDERPDNSVRGVALLVNLEVADEVDDCIRTYDVATGAYKGKLADPKGLVSSPTHLLVNGSGLYVSVKPHNGNAEALVLLYDVSGAQTLSALISNSDDLNVKAPAGMTFDGNGNFYLADRTARVVYKFDSDWNLAADGNPFIADMPDDPEFILWVNDDWIPGAS